MVLMITFKHLGRYGRFGNQLFQFASLIGIGDKLNYEVLFPKKNLKQINISSTRENKTFVAYFEINECFDIDQKFFTDDLIIERRVSERFFHFDENFFNILETEGKSFLYFPLTSFIKYMWSSSMKDNSYSFLFCSKISLISSATSFKLIIVLILHNTQVESDLSNRLSLYL